MPIEVINRVRIPKDKPCPKRKDRLISSFCEFLDTTAKEKTPYEIMAAEGHLRKLTSFAHETESFKEFVRKASDHLNESGATRDPRHPLRFLVPNEPLVIEKDVHISQFTPEEDKVWPLTTVLVKKAAPKAGEQAQETLVTLGNLFYAANAVGKARIDECMIKAMDKMMEEQKLHKYKNKQCQIG
ncbi:MAG: hypothetical protein WC408_02760 [Candidatus Micrarchaeia archaeon]|jgi:hypothetical protein